MHINKKRIYSLILISLVILAGLKLWTPNTPTLNKGDRKSITFLPVLITTDTQSALDQINGYMIKNISIHNQSGNNITLEELTTRRQDLYSQAKANLESYGEDINSPIIDYLIGKEQIRLLANAQKLDASNANEVIRIYIDLIPNSSSLNQTFTSQNNSANNELNDMKMKNLSNNLAELNGWINIVIQTDSPIHNQTLQAQSMLIRYKLADLGEFKYIFDLLDRLPNNPKDIIRDYNKIALSMMHLYGVGTVQNIDKSLDIIDTYIKVDNETINSIKATIQSNTKIDPTGKTTLTDPQIESAEFYLPILSRLYINGYTNEPDPLLKGCAMVYATLNSGYKHKNKIVSNAKEIEKYKVYCDDKLSVQEKESIKDITKMYTEERQEQLDIITQFGALKDDYIKQNSDALQDHINKDPYYTSTTLIEDSINRVLPNIEAYNELARALNYNAYECNAFAQTLLGELYIDNIGISNIKSPAHITKFKLSDNSKVNACMWIKIANIDPYNIQWCNKELTTEEKNETYTQILSLIKSDNKIFNCALAPL